MLPYRPGFDLWLFFFEQLINTGVFMKKLLIVDDNDKYARIFENYFQKIGYSQIDRAVTASSGIDMVNRNGISYYDLIVTDLTMESQLAGLRLIRYLKKNAFPKTVIVASTGFDVSIGMLLSRLYFKNKNVRFLLPKAPLLKEQFNFIRPELGSTAEEFTEV
jgi:CheY-like chemotaxis protein